MKKKGIMAIVLAAVLAATAGVLAACGSKREEVDEEDMSRWVVRFTSQYPCDMETHPSPDLYYTEKTIQELKEGFRAGNAFTIRFPWKDSYGEEPREFTLEPKVDLWYINDAGERIENGKMHEDGDTYYFAKVNRGFQNDDGTSTPVATLREVGTYALNYCLNRNSDDWWHSPDEVNYNYITIYVEIYNE